MLYTLFGASIGLTIGLVHVYKKKVHYGSDLIIAIVEVTLMTCIGGTLGLGYAAKAISDGTHPLLNH
jgi:hypothetical protein